MSEEEKINNLAYALSRLAQCCWHAVGFGPGSAGEEIVGICDAIRGLETTEAMKFNDRLSELIDQAKEWVVSEVWTEEDEADLLKTHKKKE